MAFLFDRKLLLNTGSKLYNIILNSATGGSISSSLSKAEAGTKVTLEISDDLTYRFMGLTSNPSVEFTKVYNDEYTFIMPDSDITITPEFAEISNVSFMIYDNSNPSDPYSNNNLSAEVTVSCGSTSYNIHVPGTVGQTYSFLRSEVEANDIVVKINSVAGGSLLGCRYYYQSSLIASPTSTSFTIAKGTYTGWTGIQIYMYIRS